MTWRTCFLLLILLSLKSNVSAQLHKIPVDSLKYCSSKFHSDDTLHLSDISLKEFPRKWSKVSNTVFGLVICEYDNDLGQLWFTGKDSLSDQQGFEYYDFKIVSKYDQGPGKLFFVLEDSTVFGKNHFWRLDMEVLDSQSLLTKVSMSLYRVSDTNIPQFLMKIHKLMIPNENKHLLYFLKDPYYHQGPGTFIPLIDIDWTDLKIAEKFY